MRRRKFLATAGLSIPLFSKGFPKSPLDQKPIVVSTWESGMGVNAEAWKILSNSGRALDAVESGARFMESKINCCVGLGGYPDRDGIVTLDACIMDEHSNCGAVAALERIKHPVSVARKVMELTPHILLAGKGAQEFAVSQGFPLENGELSDDAKKAYEEWKKKNNYHPEINIEKKQGGGPFAPSFFDDGTPNHDTMGLVAIDALGKMSGAVTTSGLAFKLHGRVGDSPIIGAGLFVDNEVGAATSSGVGEEVIRICGTHLVVEYMRQGYTPETACRKAIERIVKRDIKKAETIQVGFLALNRWGEYGAYSIQNGFTFSVKSIAENQVYNAKSLL